MHLVDLASAILTKTGQCKSIADARENIVKVFKSDFPYWSYGDWNVEASPGAAKVIFRIYESDSRPTINQLIIELPAFVHSFNMRDNRSVNLAGDRLK